MSRAASKKNREPDSKAMKVDVRIDLEGSQLRFRWFGKHWELYSTMMLHFWHRSLQTRESPIETAAYAHRALSRHFCVAISREALALLESVIKEAPDTVGG